MKKFLFACCFVLGGIAAAIAQDTTSTDQQDQQQYPTMQEQDRERINSRDLPDAVKRSLEAQEFRGWLINAAYKTSGVSDTTGMQDEQDQNQADTTGVSEQQTGASEEEVYVVELKNGAQTKTVRFSKDGEKLDDPGMQNDDQK